MALFCAAIRSDSVSLLMFLFFSHVQVFLRKIPLVCCMKCPYSWFFSHFCFLVIFVLLMFVLSVLFVVTVINLPLLFLSHYIDTLMLSWKLVNPLPPFFDTYSMSLSSLGCKAFFIVMNFLVPFTEVHLSFILRIVPSMLRRGQPRYLSIWWDSSYSLVLSSFLVLLRYTF